MKHQKAPAMTTRKPTAIFTEDFTRGKKLRQFVRKAGDCQDRWITTSSSTKRLKAPMTGKCIGPSLVGQVPTMARTIMDSPHYQPASETIPRNTSTYPSLSSSRHLQKTTPMDHVSPKFLGTTNPMEDFVLTVTTQYYALSAA